MVPLRDPSAREVETGGQRLQMNGELQAQRESVSENEVEK